MGPLLEGGATGEVFGYLLTDSLANSISQAGGLGFSSVIQAQLSEKKS
jgi:Rod binding domain-containing protein